jgi:hypothetical protein
MVGVPRMGSGWVLTSSFSIAVAFLSAALRGVTWFGLWLKSSSGLVGRLFQKVAHLVKAASMRSL